MTIVPGTSFFRTGHLLKRRRTCSPVGPGYDKGKGERPREEVDHKYRCNFFKWSADVRRDTLKKRGGSQLKNQP